VYAALLRIILLSQRKGHGIIDPSSFRKVTNGWARSLHHTHIHMRGLTSRLPPPMSHDRGLKS
jgi:hypothetical protein